MGATDKDVSYLINSLLVIYANNYRGLDTLIQQNPSLRMAAALPVFIDCRGPEFKDDK